MLRVRVIPCLLLRARGLVKTTKFKTPNYIGDPINTVRIFNEKEVDELIFLDITATAEQKKPQFNLISEIAGECFMPFAYGGGIRSLEDASKLFSLGVEKISLNSYAYENSDFITQAANCFGSQSIVISIDVKKKMNGYTVYTQGGKIDTGIDPVNYAKKMEESGAGELLLNSIDRDGTMAGYDLELIYSITSAVKIPVIACGGAGKLEHFTQAVKTGHASAVAAGSMFVYQGINRSVLINFPSQDELKLALH